MLIAQLPWCWWESSFRLMLALLAFFPEGAYCKPSPILQRGSAPAAIDRNYTSGQPEPSFWRIRHQENNSSLFIRS